MASRKPSKLPLKGGTKRVRFNIPMTSEELVPYVRDYTEYIPPEELREEISEKEAEVIPEDKIKNGSQLLAMVKQRMKEEKPFDSKTGDNLRAPFRFDPKIGTIKEDEEFRVRTDDRRYGVFPSRSEDRISDSGSDWSEGPDTYLQCNCVAGMKYLCCCHCFRRSSGKAAPVTKWVKEDGNTGGDNGGDNEEERKPKRVGKMKRLRNFFRRLCCCVGKSNED
ncbi:uncharacterized protein LOC134242476 [Saccostrea cucullata]|uniref:uncharacterized protein LOC134242476 n=1 Tax=Saccostrea cuccullata TaxID=36930 RepID=UPI002ED1A0BC